ncbi:hypothetical protein ACOZ38_11960 [Sphaerisporangium viridialbum]|uniref:hypothetical protein n=1 Tax=Sphaerisporangium viridialbum TaxID=46189 RepID=UPI003C7949BE
MTVRLSKRSFEFAKRLIDEGHYVLDEMDDWSEHQPSTRQENDFIEKHGFAEYAKWHLAEDDESGEETKSRYKFPYGDFEKVHWCGVIAAEVRAARLDYTDVEVAAAHLHGMLDELRSHQHTG